MKIVKITLLIVSIFSFLLVDAQNKKVIKITAIPKEASIYINNQFINYGLAEFPRPKKKEVIAIRIECQGYKPLDTKFYGDDKRNTVSYSLQDDGFYRTTASSGLVNKFITVDISTALYDIKENDNVDCSKAWKLLHQILLNYFEEFSASDIHGGYLQTPWHYKTFQLSDKVIRTRVTVRDISTPDKVAFQIKVSSETASAQAARNGEFTSVERIIKEMEPMIQELQTRLGKMHNL